jgi:hypothetical protein
MNDIAPTGRHPAISLRVENLIDSVGPTSFRVGVPSTLQDDTAELENAPTCQQEIEQRT